MRLESSRPSIHALGFNSFRNWVTLCRRHRPDATHWKRCAFITGASLLTAPLRIADRFQRDRLERISLDAPVFVIGHWRSGTTYLQNMLCTNPAFGHTTIYQSIIPGAAFSGRYLLKPLLARLLPTARGIDGMEMTIDSPQEDEVIFTHTSVDGFYHHWYFPHHAEFYFRRTVLFEGMSEADMTRWQRTYRLMLAKASAISGQRQLVLKNPATTARIPMMRSMFPEARFIYLIRNPVHVFRSTMRLYQTMVNFAQLQHIGEQELEELVFLVYRELLQRYLHDRPNVPANRLIEVRFEEMEQHPYETVRAIYRRLDLPFDAEADRQLQAYIHRQRTYQKNNFHNDDALSERVYERLQFVFDAWNYPAPLATVG